MVKVKTLWRRLRLYKDEKPSRFDDILVFIRYPYSPCRFTPLGSAVDSALEIGCQTATAALGRSSDAAGASSRLRHGRRIIVGISIARLSPGLSPDESPRLLTTCVQIT
ncbi:hypothetical protein RoseRS_3374 [Roseiflexus sp. RS-1]|jgi:hypothetical protein|nr:hypothetical protein RoseRS_3374 [Roseiflexus sp. RS-1]